MRPERTRYPLFVRLLPIAIFIVAGASYKIAVTPKRDWVRVARDANYDIALDRANVTPVEVAMNGQWRKAYEVWYRTDHARPRMHKDKTFDREVVRAIIQCDRLLFKVLSVDMSVGDGRPVARLRNADDDPWRQQWRNVENGATEEIAATAACHFGRQASHSVADGRRR